MKKLFFLSLFFSSLLFSKDQTTVYFQDESGNLITAQETIESTPEEASLMENFPTQNYQKALIRMFGIMMAIVAFIIMTYWFTRRFMHAKIHQVNDSKSIKILEKRVLSPKSILYLIEAEGKKVLISESQHEVRALHAIDEANELIPQEIEY